MDIELYKQSGEIIIATGRIPKNLMPATRDESVIVLAQYPKQYYATLKPRTINECLLSNVCTLGAFNRATTNDITGDMTARAMVLLMITDIVEAFNVGKTMTDGQQAQTADLIIDNYGYMKIDDFKYCFTQGKMERYGKVYDRLDCGVIIGWIEAYMADRFLAADNTSYSEHVSNGRVERTSESIMEIARRNKANE